MIQVSPKILLHDNSDKTPPAIIDKIPGDEVCVISFGGGGIVNYDRADKLARILSGEILKDVGDIHNYAVFYDGVSTSDVPFLRANERLLFERKEKNFLPKEDASIYISEQNINTVFHQRIRPLIALRGMSTIKTLNFVSDDDTQKLTGIIKDKIKQIAGDMNISNDELKDAIRHISTHVFSYDKYFAPQHLDDLFDRVLLPRISNENGGRLPIDVALRRIRKINIFAHCYGGYVALLLEERMQNKMRELGYSEPEMNQIQSQLLVLALNPSCPLGISKSQFISFISGYDDKVMRPDNWASEFVNENRVSELKRMNELPRAYEWKLRPSFLTKQNGNVFFVKQRFELVDGNEGKIIGYNEHNNMHWISNKFTDDGKLLATLSRNILVSGLKNSLIQTESFVPLPPLANLILDGKNDEKLIARFDTMVQNGKDFMKDALKYALMRVRTRMRHGVRPKPKESDEQR